MRRLDVTNIVSLAREFAVTAHAGQKYGDRPYSAHLDAVVAILEPHSEWVQAVGYLHDVIEDTPATRSDVEQVFGSMIAGWVALVTDEPGATRRERKTKTNAKLAAVDGGADGYALIVKAADRLANLRESAAGGDGSKLEMYRREHAAFRATVYRLGLCDDLWREMDAIVTVGLDNFPGRRRPC